MGAAHAPCSRYSSSAESAIRRYLRPASRLPSATASTFEKLTARRECETAPLFGFAVAYAKRLQSGRLDACLLYMLIALVAVIAVVTALA